MNRNIDIHLGSSTGPLYNFWNNFHFHPTDAIEDAWGQRILKQVAADGVAETVRMYTMMEDIVSMDADGKLQYDFTLNDIRLDFMIAHGFNIFLSYNFIPPCIATDPNESSVQSKQKTRYKGKVINTSPPRDYALWEEICYTYTAHIVEKYGLDRVSSWQLQCYNEPDHPAYWMKNTDRNECVHERAAEYCKLYCAFANGVKRVSDKLQIGGPALASNLIFLEDFMIYTKQNAIPLDFLSFHSYGTSVSRLNSGERLISIRNSLPYFENALAICKRTGYEGIPLILDEWGACSSGFLNSEDAPLLTFRDNEAYAAYFVKMLTLWREMGIPFEKILICLSGQHESKTDFAAFRSYFTLNFFRKPIYNAYILASKPKGDALSFEKDGDEEGLLSVLPARDKDGTVRILLGYGSEHFDEALPDAALKITTGLSKDASVTLTRIDALNASPLHCFRELGSPEHPTEEQLDKIRNASLLSSEAPYTLPACNPLCITVPNNGVVLAEIKEI